jgi:magnesium-transporting ATPase (P-type)
MSQSADESKPEATLIYGRAHVMTTSEVEDEMNTSIEHGLTLEEHELRLQEFGPNKIPEQKTVSVWEILWAQINSMVIYILIIGGAISFAFDHLVDGVVIVGVVIINVGLGFYMEMRAISATDSLKNMMSPIAQVVRSDEKITVETLSLVPGDIILLQPGDIVPADSRVVKQSNLQIVEAALTGESHATMKDVTPAASATVGLADRKCMVFSGTQVIKGTATCIVTATAGHCEIGKISGLLADIKPAKTPLLLQLETFGMILSIIIIGFAFGTFGIAYARGYSVGDALSIAIGVAVAAIPEGLPSCITVTFAIGVRFLALRNAIVKSLPAVETLGSVSVICSDKTGTLTMNKMSVQRVVRLSDKDAEVRWFKCISAGAIVLFYAFHIAIG